MGKIRVKTLGDENLEKEQKKETKKRIEAKKARLSSPESEANGGQEAKVQAVEKTVEEETPRQEKEKVAKTPRAAEKKDKFAQKKKSRVTRSKKYQAAAKTIDKNKIYKLSEALDILPNLHIAKFDETVELHLNTTGTGISGNLNLPHGTGKKVRVAIATDELIAQVEKGKYDFDILLAAPQMMPKLAKVARVLGPRGLMPNPKNGTVSQNPEEAAKKFEGGQTSFKTEAKMPIIHLSVGKLSFGKEKLSANIKTAINTIQTSKIKKTVLKSTMSPGLKIDFSNI